MKELEINIKKNGFYYKQVFKNETGYVYSQHLKEKGEPIWPSFCPIHLWGTRYCTMIILIVSTSGAAPGEADRSDPVAASEAILLAGRGLAPDGPAGRQHGTTEVRK